MAEQVRDIMTRILAEYHLTDNMTENRLIENWPRIIGEPLARQCVPVGIENSILYLRARNEAWRTELASKHDQLLNLVKKNTGIHALTKLIFLEEE